MLGLSQSELAEHLAIPRSTLSMAETNQRMLPAAVLLKIADLQLKMNNNRGKRMELLTREELPVKRMPDDLSFESMRANEQLCNYKLHVMKVKLNNMSNQYDHLRQSRAAIENVLNEKAETAPDHIFWKWQHEKVLAKLNNCSLYKQDRLRLQIKMLETEALYYK